MTDCQVPKNSLASQKKDLQGSFLSVISFLCKDCKVRKQGFLPAYIGKAANQRLILKSYFLPNSRKMASWRVLADRLYFADHWVCEVMSPVGGCATDCSTAQILSEGSL